MTPTLRRFALLPLAALLLVTLPACDSGGDEDDGGGATGDLVFLGINFDRLFAEPTAAEIQAVQADWASRSPDAQDAEVVSTAAFDGATHYVVTHTVDEGPGAPLTHYALVRVPDALTDAASAALLVVHHGGDDGVGAATTTRDGTANTSVQAMAASFPELFAQTVQVVPTYRSEELRLDGTALTCGDDGGQSCVSGGTESPWDYDVDDAMALLSAVLALDELDGLVDPERVGVIGYSRGGNTAALHAARDARVDALTDYYGPTDFFNPVVTSVASRDGVNGLAVGLLFGDPGVLGLPGAQFLRDEVFLPLRNADGSYNAGADYAGARLEVVRRSASLFAADLPAFQVHHHRLDGVVPVGFSQAFQARAGGGGDFNYYGPETGELSAAFHAPEVTPDMQPSLQRTQDFLLGVLGAPAARERVLSF